MRAATILFALFACSHDDPGTTNPSTTTDPSTTDPTDTGVTTTTSTAGDAIAVSCAAQPDNVLRYDCAVTTTTAGALDVSWEPVDGGTARGFRTATSGTDHAFTVYAMKPQVPYRVSFTGPDGTAAVRITPEALPSSVAPTLSASGAATTGPVLIQLPCATEPTVAIVDVDGEVLWYQVLGVSEGRDGGYHFTPEGTVLTGMGDTVLEHALDGTERLRFERGVDFDGPLHHDIHRGGNGLTYALFAEQVGSYITDGVYVFDADGLVATWHLADHLTVGVGGGGGMGGGFWQAEFPNATDWSHGNSVHVDADGTMWLSFRWLSTALQVDGDPTSPTFGAVDWQLVGEAGNGIASDFAISATDGTWSDFEGQHHVNPTPDGRLALFDNRSGTAARGIVLALDAQAGTAVIEESWPMNRSCGAQGSTYVLDNGHGVLTCGTETLVQEFAPGSDTAVWTLDLTCGSGGGPGGGSILPRGIPTSL